VTICYCLSLNDIKLFKTEEIKETYMIKKFWTLISNPIMFFEMVRSEDWKPALVFFLEKCVLVF